MFFKQQYELVDFGKGEKLERFGDVLVQRPCPAASNAERNLSNWSPQLSFRAGHTDSIRGKWRPDSEFNWQITTDQICFNLTPTPFGHLGIFPEQSDNWSWILGHGRQLDGLKVLNLFAYTGGTTMAFASCGAEVVHIDSSKSVVAWARENARLANLQNAKVRWIVEDAMTFVDRELKRGNHYDMVVADPPSFGHGTKRQSWKFERDIEPLIYKLAKLTRNRFRGLLISGHTTGFDRRELNDMIRKEFEYRNQVSGGLMKLESRDGRILPSGYYVRCFERTN